MKIRYKVMVLLSAFLLGCCIICVNSFLSGSSRTPDSMSNHIFIISDVHYFSDKLHDRGDLFQIAVNRGDGKNLFYQNEILSSLERTLKKEKPSALLITGDLTLNGERLSHKDFASFLKGIETLGVNVYVIPGNHDINNPRSLKFIDDKAYPADSITPDDFTRIYGKFGYKNALSYDRASLSYLIEPLPGVQVLMLDTNKYENNRTYGSSVGSGKIRPETRAWISDLAGKASAEEKRIFVAMHHSLIEHNPMVSEGFTIDDSNSLISFFTGLGIPLVLTGHIHIQDIVMEESGGHRIYDIATNALSVYPHNYGVLTVQDDQWEYRSSPSDVAGWAEENGREDLMDFGEMARAFFWGRSDLMVRKSLSQGEYTEEETEKIAQITGGMNVNFFAGRKDLNPSSVDEDLLENLFHGDNLFLKNYLISILHDDGYDDNHLVISFPSS